MAPPLAVFVDTQTLLHYRWLDQIDWCSVLEAPAVEIMVAPIVIKELDKLKHAASRKKLRDRARTRVSQLHKALDATPPYGRLRENVTVRYELREPLSELAALGLDREVNDDRLIGTIIAFSRTNNGTRVALVADDLGLRLKAKEYNIELASLPEEYGLEDEPDSAEVKAQQLEQEVRKYKNRAPDLRVTFAGERDHIRIDLPAPVTLSEEDVVARVNETATKLCPQYKRPLPPSPEATARDFGRVTFNALNFINEPSPGEIERYEKERQGFLKVVEQYWRIWPSSENRRRLTVELQLFAVNLGTAPAEDILVVLHVPDGLNVLNKEPETLKKPVPPVKPRSHTEMMHESLLGGLANLSSFSPDIRDFKLRGNVSSPTIRRTNSFEIDITLDKLTHQRREPLDPLYLVFERFESAVSFTIGYRISSASLPEVIDGQLHVVVERTPSS